MYEVLCLRNYKELNLNLIQYKDSYNLKFGALLKNQ